MVEKYLQDIYKWKRELQQARVALRSQKVQEVKRISLKLQSDGDETRLKPSLIGEVRTTKVKKVERSSRYFSPPIEMGMLYGSDPTGLQEGLDDDMHYTIGILFFENDVSLVSSDLLPYSSGSSSPNLPMVLFTILVNFYLSQLKL